MGAGSFGAGVGPAGVDPAVPGSPRATTAPAAELFDFPTGTFPLAADGTSPPMDPTDQQVLLIARIRKGGFRSNPQIGIDTDAIKRAPPSAVQMVADAEVRAAYAALIQAGDITISNVAVDEDSLAAGRLFFAFQYENLRAGRLTPSQRTRTIKGTG